MLCCVVCVGRRSEETRYYCHWAARSQISLSTHKKVPITQLPQNSRFGNCIRGVRQKGAYLSVSRKIQRGGLGSIERCGGVRK